MVNRICAFVLISVSLSGGSLFADSQEPIEETEATEQQPVATTANQIVVITDPEFVPISQYFATELNQLPPSSAGQQREDLNPDLNPK